MLDSTSNSNDQNSPVQAWAPKAVLPETFANRCTNAIESIKTTMLEASITTVSCSFGKDSTLVLALSLEAACQLKDEGESPTVRIITSDTGVENPSQSKLNVAMSTRALAWADEHGLDVQQIFVKPDPMESYLVTMCGGRGIASVSGSDATCSMNLKIRPIQKSQRQFVKQYGAENILTLIGTRFEESATRGTAMRKRNESATVPVRSDTGILTLSPVADWLETDVWRFLNGSERTIGFKTFDFTPVLAHYEAMGDSSCGSVDFAQSIQQAKSPCSGGRGGCFVCQKVSADHSLLNMLDKFPAYEPLTRLSKVIRAGHLVPENRSFLSKAADSQGRIRVFSNAYSPAWTSQLLKWIMTIDANEDDRARARSAKLGRPVERRFPPLLDEEQQMLIAFQWARYGVQKVGEYPRIREAILGGQRFAMPGDDELADLQAWSDKKLMGKTVGYLQVEQMDHSKPVYQDHWRDLIGTESGCTPPIMMDDNGERAMYRSKTGMIHDSIETGDLIECDLTNLRDPDGTLGIIFEDFCWWYAMDFADGRKTSNDEMDFLIREGLIRARNGYQSTLANYQRYNLVLNDLRENGPIDTLAQIQAHPDFIIKTDADTTQAASTASNIIATSRKPATGALDAAVNDAEHDDPKSRQLDLLLA